MPQKKSLSTLYVPSIPDDLMLDFPLESLPPGCERLPTVFATEAEARTAGQALNMSFLIEQHVVGSMPQRRRGNRQLESEGNGRTEATYAVLLCPEELRQTLIRDWHKRVTKVRSIYYQPILDDSTVDSRLRSLLAISCELACPWPKPLTPEEQAQAQAVHARRMSQMKRESKQRSREFDAWLAQAKAEHTTEKQQVKEAIAQGIASPWEEPPGERERILQEMNSRQERERQEFLHTFRTREAILGGIACTWKPSLEVLTALALEQSLACPWPEPSTPARQQHHNALSPGDIQRLRKIIVRHHRRSTS
jgi:hypothetical protein